MPLPSVKQVIARCGLQLLSTFIALFVLTALLIKRLIVGADFFKVTERPTPPAILNDPKWGTHNYANLKSQGIRLHYVEAGDHQKPLILCIHGFPECWFSWRHQLQHLSQNYWVVAVDLRGYGDSDKPPKTSAYNSMILVEDLRQFVLALGKDKCTLLAHDWGGALAWQLVIKHPELFNYHISCNGPHPTVFMNQLRSSWKQKLRSWYILFFQTPWIPELAFSSQDLMLMERMFRGKLNNVEAFPDDVIEAYKYHFSQKDAFTPPINYYRNIDFTAPSVKIPKVTVPTLIIWGVNDLALGKDLATQAVNECESAEVKFVEGASHWVQQDKPKEVNAYIQEYLSAKH